MIEWRIDEGFVHPDMLGTSEISHLQRGDEMTSQADSGDLNMALEMLDKCFHRASRSLEPTHDVESLAYKVMLDD